MIYLCKQCATWNCETRSECRRCYRRLKPNFPPKPPTVHHSFIPVFEQPSRAALLARICELENERERLTVKAKELSEPDWNWHGSDYIEGWRSGRDAVINLLKK